jgi:hypothetical protein
MQFDTFLAARLIDNASSGYLTRKTTAWASPPRPTGGTFSTASVPIGRKTSRAWFDNIILRRQSKARLRPDSSPGSTRSPANGMAPLALLVISPVRPVRLGGQYECMGGWSWFVSFILELNQTLSIFSAV